MIHDNSGRRAGRFVEVNCAALSRAPDRERAVRGGRRRAFHRDRAHRRQGRCGRARHVAAGRGQRAAVRGAGQAAPAAAVAAATIRSAAADAHGADVRVIAATNAGSRTRGRRPAAFAPTSSIGCTCVPIRVLSPRRASRRTSRSSRCSSARKRSRATVCRAVGLSAQVAAGTAARWSGPATSGSSSTRSRRRSSRRRRLGANQVEQVHSHRGVGTSGRAPEVRSRFRRRHPSVPGGARRASARGAAGGTSSIPPARLDVARSHLYNLIRAFGLERAGR